MLKFWRDSGIDMKCQHNDRKSQNIQTVTSDSLLTQGSRGRQLLLKGRLKCVVPRCQLLLMLLLHRCWLLSCCCCCWRQARHCEARKDAQVAEDHSLAKQRRGVGCLHNLLGLGLLALNLQQENGVRSLCFSSQVSLTFLFLMV